VVARDLKTLGFYTARALSFDGVEYDVLEHALTSAQTEIYDAYAGAFRTIHHNLEAALTATGVNDASGETNASAAKASAKSRFESTKQRFFNHLLMGMKAPSIVSAIQQDLSDGFACVIQVVSTGESLLKRRLEVMNPDDELVEGALTPREYVLGYLEQAFPIHTQKMVEIDGNIVAEPLRDATGALVVSREALALRDEAMMVLMALAPIPSALDQILWAFGDEAVAEVTGRSIRPLKSSDGALFIEKRAASSNSSETQAFMDGDKNVLRRKRPRTRSGVATTCWSRAGVRMRPFRGLGARIALPRSARRSSGFAPRTSMARNASPRRSANGLISLGR